MGWVDNAMSRPLSPGEGDQEPLVQEAGWAPRPVSTAAEQLIPTGIRSALSPARSKSLHGLSCAGPLNLLHLAYIAPFMTGHKQFATTARGKGIVVVRCESAGIVLRKRTVGIVESVERRTERENERLNEPEELTSAELIGL